MMLELDIGNNIKMKILEKRECQYFFDYIDRDRQNCERWIPFVSRTKTVTDAEAYISKFLEKFKNGEGYFWGLWEHKKIIGLVLIKDINHDLSLAEIGYMIDKEYEGKKIVKKACDLMIDFIFDELKLNKIRICCNDKNNKSMVFPEKYGFKLEGVIRNDVIINNERCNTMYWGLFRDEYKKE